VLQVRPLSPQSFVLEIGSNDGYLLQNYQAAGIPCLGIEPASGPTRVALEKGIPTLGKFFTLELAQNLADKGIRADVIHVNDVLPFVADVDGFVAGMALLLKESGVAVIEVLYWGNVVENCEIGSINHLHYFSLHSLSFLFRKHGLFPRSVKIVPVIGGSLRLFLTKDDHPDDSILELIEAEEQQGMHRLDYALNYAQNLLGMKHSLLNLLREIKRRGKRIAAYGAGAKGITLLNFLEIAPGMINFVVDSQPRKQGLYLPGVHVKINSPEKLLEAMPDYVLILAWNFAQEIMAGQQEYQQRGGNFIIPLPTPKIIYGVPQ
jgi:hypothetical protein